MKGKTTNKKQLIRIIACAMAMLLSVGLLASCDKAGPQGEPGAPGQDGKSAYELAVENGYTGTVEEWLASLVGEVGATGESGSPGINGKSAYEIAVEKGYQGTEEEWLTSLIGSAGKDGANGQDGADGKDGTNGKDGANGKSAYDLAVANGFKGSLSEWLDSLVGEDGRNGNDGKDGTNGSDGKSAYDLAVENGFKGSLTEWLASLVGKDGAAAEKGEDGKDGVNGKSAYELAVENGYKGDVQSWLASLVGKDGTNGSDGKNGLSAYEIAVKNGYKGSESDWIASLVGAKGEKGDKGDTGPAGADGKDGADGITPLLRINTATNMWEVSCDNGKTWKSLNVPATGEDGQDGADGQKGDRGDKGDKGDTGAAGHDGIDGSDGKDGVSIIDAYVDADMHLWIELSNGNKIDAGYVGVEIIPIPTTYTVTFVDYDGSVLQKITDIEKGSSVTAPSAPTRDGYKFVGWDKDYSNITTDLVVTAQYEIITEPAIVVENATVTEEATEVSVKISLMNNPGLASLQIKVSFDDSLVLKNITFNPAFGAYVTAPQPYSNPQYITFISPLSEVKVSGEFAILTFDVIDTVSSGDVLRIEITPVAENIYDEDFNDVVFEIINGTVTIS